MGVVLRFGFCGPIVEGAQAHGGTRSSNGALEWERSAMQRGGREDVTANPNPNPFFFGFSFLFLDAISCFKVECEHGPGRHTTLYPPA